MQNINITLRCDELGRINEGFGRKERGVVHTAEDDGDGVELQGVVGLLRDVVSADGVLKTDVKPDGEAKKKHLYCQTQNECKHIDPNVICKIICRIGKLLVCIVKGKYLI